MKLDRFRAPALAATAVLMISGVGSAFAASHATVAPVQVAPVTQEQVSVPEPVEAADTDTLQEGDQTTVDIAGSADTTAEAPEAAGVEASSAEADGPAGHADADGQNVDHQFDGNE